MYEQKFTENFGRFWEDGDGRGSTFVCALVGVYLVSAPNLSVVGAIDRHICRHVIHEPRFGRL